MSLPLIAIDRLFDRLNATYGRDFMSRWEGQNSNAVKASWAHELSTFERNLPMIAWALENLPERAPNVIEFRNLCRRAPAPELQRLPEPQADPARVSAELAKLAPIRRAAATGGMHDGKAWARRLIARHEAGDVIRIHYLNLARGVLRLRLETEAV